MSDAITRSQLIEQIADKQDRLQTEDIKLAVQSSFEYLSRSLSLGNRIEIRGLGSFCLHFKKPKTIRNPKTGKLIDITGRNTPYFKPSSILNKRLNRTHSDDIASDALVEDDY